MRTRAALAAIVAISLTLAVAACGGNTSKSDSAASQGTSGSADSKGTGAINVKPRTIGVVNLVRQSPAEDKMDQVFEKEGKALGWDVKIVDGAGDPQKIASAAQSFVNQGVDALITTSTEAAAIRGALKQAKSKGIPTISTNGGTTKSSLFTVQYEEDETMMGTQLAQYIHEHQPDLKLADLTTNIAISGTLRNDAIHKYNPASAFLAEQNVDLTNPVVNTEKTLTDMLTAHPDINAVHAVYDNMAQASITTIRSKGSKAKLYTYYTTPNNVKNLRGNTALAALSDVDAPKTAAVAFDQLLRHFEKGTDLDPNALQVDKLTYNVVDKANVDKLLAGRDQQYTVDGILAPFLEKWAKEYPAST